MIFGASETRYSFDIKKSPQASGGISRNCAKASEVGWKSAHSTRLAADRETPSGCFLIFRPRSPVGFLWRVERGQRVFG